MRAEDSLLWLRGVPFWHVLTEIKVFTWLNTDLPLLPKTHKVDYSLNSETFQTPPWFGLETVEIISPLRQSFVVYAWVFENTRLTTLWSDDSLFLFQFLACSPSRLVSRCTAPYCTELGFASRPCGHTAFCRMCLKLSSVRGREQYNQGSVLFKDCNVGSSNSPGLRCFTAQLSHRGDQTSY